ncbi:MAG: ABC transporter permease [Caldisericia bacterium]|jgi:ABC-2 type transport system permease protein|nr:ABC transporter permease [Caldisericia bacterium]
MKKFLVLFKKEIKSLITLQLIIPLVIMVVLFSIIGNIVGKETKKATEPKEVAILDYDDTFLSKEIINILSNSNFKVKLLEKSLSKEDAKELIKKERIQTLIVIPFGFQDNISRYIPTEIETYSILTGLSFVNIMHSVSTNAILNSINESISDRYISERFFGMNPQSIKRPVNVKSFVIVKDKISETTIETIANAITSQSAFIPIILMIVIIFSSQMIASSIAQEKENKTLETLLTIPINRTSIIFAKMLSSGVIALIMSAIYIIGMRSYLTGITGSRFFTSSTQDISKILSDLGLTFNTTTYIVLGISLFFGILCALSLATILAVYADSVQSAQTLLTPLMVMVLIPYFLSLFMDLNSLPFIFKIIIFLIPFSHPFMANTYLSLGNYLIPILGIFYEILFFLICLYIATKIFSSDKIITTKLKITKRISF